MATGFDRRRINGPEESFTPVYEEDEADQVTSGPSRVGRAPLDIRPICMSNPTRTIEILWLIIPPASSEARAYQSSERVRVH